MRSVTCFPTLAALHNAMSQSMAAQDSQGSVSGTPFTATQRARECCRGLTLSLRGVGRAVTVSTELSQISDAVRSFVDAYNIAQSDIAASSPENCRETGFCQWSAISTRLTGSTAIRVERILKRLARANRYYA